MSDYRNRITTHIQGCVTKIEALVRDEVRAEALALVTAALGQVRAALPAAGRPANASPRPASVLPHPAPASASAAIRGSKGNTGRRSSVRMQRDMDAMVAYVRGHPGAKMEEIAAAIGSTSHRLNTPMHKLVAAGTLKSKGARRGSRYSLRD